MDAKYIKKEIADLNGTGQTQAYYKMETRSMSHESFVDLCARESGMPKSAIVGVLSLVSQKLALSMAEGYAVKIDGIGTFTAKLGVRDNMLQDAFEPGEHTHNAHTIEVTGVGYRADNDLIKETGRKCHLVRGGESRIHKPKYTLEERIEKARLFLAKHTVMHLGDYVRLTGLSRTAASLELRKLVNDPSSGIIANGRGSQKLWLLGG